MPVYIALEDIQASSAIRAAMNRPGLQVNRPADFIPEGTPIPGQYAAIGRFRAPNREVAHEFFLKFQEDGFPPGDPDRVIECGSDAAGDSAPYWRFRGDVKYLKARKDLFGYGEGVIATKHIERDPRFREITNLLNQLQDRYSRARKEGGVAVLAGPERTHVEQTLRRASVEEAKLGITFAAACDALDAACRAFGVEHTRTYTVPGLKPEPEPDPVISPAPDGPGANVDTAPDAPAEPPVKPHRRPPARAN